MLGTLLAKVFGTENERILKRLRPAVAAINACEAEIRALGDADLRSRTVRLREQAIQGTPLAPTPG